MSGTFEERIKKRVSFGLVDLGMESIGAVFIKPRQLGRYHSDLGSWQVETGMNFYPVVGWNPIDIPNPRINYRVTGFDSPAPK